MHDWWESPHYLILENRLKWKEKHLKTICSLQVVVFFFNLYFVLSWHISWWPFFSVFLIVSLFLRHNIHLFNRFRWWRTDEPMNKRRKNNTHTLKIESEKKERKQNCNMRIIITWHRSKSKTRFIMYAGHRAHHYKIYNIQCQGVWYYEAVSSSGAYYINLTNGYSDIEAHGSNGSFDVLNRIVSIISVAEPQWSSNT